MGHHVMATKMIYKGSCVTLVMSRTSQLVTKNHRLSIAQARLSALGTYGRAGALALRYGPKVFQAAKQISKMYSKKGSASKQTETSLQHTRFPISMQYRRKSMPRRKRRRYVKSVRRFRSMLYKNVPNSTQIFNNFYTAAAAINKQAYASVCLGPMNGILRNGRPWMNDLNQVAGTLTAAVAGAYNNSQIMLDNQTIDIYLYNPSTTRTVDIDVYMFVPRKIVSDQTQDAFVRCTNAITSVPNTAFLPNALLADSVGVTPFQGSNWCSEFKILYKKKILLSPGETTTFSYRNNKNYKLNIDEITNNTYKPGLTKGWLFVGNGPHDGTNWVDCTFTVSFTKSYSARYIEANQPNTSGQIVQ